MYLLTALRIADIVVEQGKQNGDLFGCSLGVRFEGSMLKRCSDFIIASSLGIIHTLNLKMI